jgi:hypothetical protein
MGSNQPYEIVPAFGRLRRWKGGLPSNFGVICKRERDYILAHMWFDLVASQGTRQYAIVSRERVPKQMTPAQIAEVRKLAREWKPTPKPRLSQ